MPSKTLSLYIYVKVDIDVNARYWFNIDKYITLSSSVYLHWQNTIPIVNETSQRTVAMNFGWSLKPIFVWFAVTFGINLDRSKKKSTIGQCLTSLFCVSLLFCINIPLNIFYIVNGTKVVTNSSSKKSFVYITNKGIGWILCAILNILVHISILVSTNGKWKTLWDKLQLLQKYIDDGGRFYRQLRLHTIQEFKIFSLVNIA